MRTPRQIVDLVMADFKDTVLDGVQTSFYDGYFVVKMGESEVG